MTIPEPGWRPTAETNAVLRHRVEELSEAYSWLTQESRRIHDEAAKISGTATSSDGMVTVTVGAGGQVVGLTLEPRATRRAAIDDLSAAIMETVNSAMADAQQHRADLMKSVLPPVFPGGGASLNLTEPSTWTPDRPLTDEAFDEWFAKIRGTGKPERRT